MPVHQVGKIVLIPLCNMFPSLLKGSVLEFLEQKMQIPVGPSGGLGALDAQRAEANSA